MKKPDPAVWFPTIRTGTGTDIYTENLVKGLQERGVRSSITWLPHRAEYLPWSVSIPKPPTWANIVHINTWTHPRFLQFKLPTVATMHHCVHDPAFTPYKNLAQKIYHRFWIKPIEEKALANAIKVIAVSRHTADQTESSFSISGIEVIHNGVNTDIFCPAKTQKHHRPFRLLYIGNWSARKGVDLLGSIMKNLGPEFELHYTGRHREGLPTNTHAIGHPVGTLALVDAYRNADALLFPSRLEGFGLVAMEAQACGVPVIATKSSSLTEVVADGVTGILCPQDNVPAFTEAIRYVATDPNLGHKMSQAARTHSEKYFDCQKMTDKYLDLYSSIKLALVP